MGGDGGSIRRRSDVVKVKKRAVQENDPAVAQRERWTTCALSSKPLLAPVVTCGLGYLYNREAVCLYLANVLNGSQKPIPQFSHLKGLRDVFACNLYYDGQPPQQQQPQVQSDEDLVRVFSCPISGIDASGKYPFVRMTGCGCVLSQKSLDSVSGNDPDPAAAATTAGEEEEQKAQAEGENGTATDPGVSPPGSAARKVTCIACGKETDPQEGAEFSEKETAGVPAEMVARVRRSVPPKAPMTPLNGSPDVVDELRRVLAVRSGAIQQARAELKTLKKAHKKSAKRRHEEAAADAGAETASADGSASEPPAKQKDRKKPKTAPKPAAAAQAPPVLSMAAKLALEAEQAARSKMSDNLRSLFLSKEKREEAPNFASTAMQSPMSRL